MGWSFPWASSSGSDFNYDYQAAVTKEQWQSGAVEYNFRRADFRPEAGQDSSGLDEFASAYERGLDGLWGMYQWLDRAPLGRNETGFWWRRHDEYSDSKASQRQA